MVNVTINGLDVNVEQYNCEGEQILVLLHGFTGSTKTWQHVIEHLPVAVRVITIDLIGHGMTAAPEQLEPYSVVAQVQLLEELFAKLELERFTLLGYSMGGRVALSYAACYPQRIEQLILESASPGLASLKERATRKLTDEVLADNIIANGIVSFVEKWENIPLFASQKSLPEDVKQEIRKERLAQREIGLANSLRGMGTGIMPALWHQLAELSMPVLLITGSLDFKFEQLAQKMVVQLKQGSHISVNEVGHAIHVENPAQFATIVKESLIQ
ncbi:2-succinyl-6-hydroxy-2,4-cyclohexadiene-1-carboxylate synthase [Solibacillus sp. FSL H8-0538]|uniref:2-succinyl-6-hydroxy-2, 4-cyclohexadiene-1-carboxylate synthase n=1 Tax=Solibacillus sp. FSL H8-0538 TaxID=2921400 RepID=UPI0030F59F8A